MSLSKVYGIINSNVFPSLKGFLRWKLLDAVVPLNTVKWHWITSIHSFSVESGPNNRNVGQVNISLYNMHMFYLYLKKNNVNYPPPLWDHKLIGKLVPVLCKLQEHVWTLRPIWCEDLGQADDIWWNPHEVGLSVLPVIHFFIIFCTFIKFQPLHEN